MLQEYQRKRDFKKTPEPSGRKRKTKAGSKNLSFVIQKHAARRLHYDFRLEIDGVMVSWAVPKGPSLNSADRRLAVMTEDHPMEYSDFEGIIPEKQYGAGEVIIWDRGEYSPDEDGELSWDKKRTANQRMRKALQEGKLSFTLKGDKLQGSWTLVRMQKTEKDWLLIKHQDEFEDEKKDITKENASVISGTTIEDMQENGAHRIWTARGSEAADPETTGRSSKKGKKTQSAKGKPKASVKEVKKEKDIILPPDPPKKKEEREAQIEEILKSAKKAAFPRSISPMLATLADDPFELKGWFYEPKLDGIRTIAFVRNGKVRLSSRRGLDLTDKYPEVCESLAEQDGNFVFDGEIVALDEKGKPSFQHLQQSGRSLKSFAKNRSDRSVTILFYVFDVLHANGKDLSALPLSERKILLASFLQSTKIVRLVRSLGSDGPAAFSVCVETGLEGIVGKKDNSTYEVGKRTRSWLKFKTAQSAEFLICGYTEGTGSRNNSFGSLILGEHDDAGNLQYVGNVGTGFNQRNLPDLLEKMKPLIQKKSPFEKKITGKLNPTWLKPQLVAQVKFMERTQDNMLRAPVFMHLRVDVEPASVTEPDTLHVHIDQRKRLHLAADSNQKKKHA